MIVLWNQLFKRIGYERYLTNICIRKEANEQDLNIKTIQRVNAV